MNARLTTGTALLLMAVVGTAWSANEIPYKVKVPYQVQDGNKVDANTLKGWRTWRAMACERCHGANQEGLVGPSLIESFKVLSEEDFKTTVLRGRIDKGMPNFDGSKQLVDNISYLYGYLKGRSDGAIDPGRLQEISR